jgi:hypothetical protein
MGAEAQRKMNQRLPGPLPPTARFSKPGPTVAGPDQSLFGDFAPLNEAIPPKFAAPAFLMTDRLAQRA